MSAKSKSPLRRTAGQNPDRATATKFALSVYFTPKVADSQAFIELSSLVDLATVEAEEHFNRAAEFERLASQHRRKAFHALDQLRELQRLIPTSGGQAR